MKRLSLNSDGAFLTTIQSLIPQSKNNNSAEKEKNTSISTSLCSPHRENRHYSILNKNENATYIF